ncbi:MAG: insulinase family protein [Muribaculaceae bacterium]|nr:insulinase family protein [Muribaculaceae bacterium]
MIRKFTFLAAALIGLNAFAANISPEVRTGTLPNGLTYYIQKNDTPEHSADFFLAQKVGSVNEEEDQRGLAHFLEHMCFNGTEHFPGNSLITYLESIGVKFGAHLNAYTSTDETVYNICKAPTVRQGSVDSCLMILSDWCAGILLKKEDIDNERGIIVNEWRQRNSPSNRMLEKASPRLYGGSLYGERLPIGLMSVVENFPPETLRRYYNKWYIPANQAVIVVGDIDPDHVEAEIKSQFSKLPAKRGSKSRKAELPEVPVENKVLAVCASDPEQGQESMQLYFRMPALDEAADEKRAIVADMVSGILAERFDGIEASDDCPHISLALGPSKYLLSRGEKSFTMRGPVKPGKSEKAVETWIGEIARAKQHGFSEEEIAKAREDARASIARRSKAHDKPNNTYLARLCVRHFLDGGKKEADSVTAARANAIIDGVTNKDLTDYLQSFDLNAGRGAVIIHYGPETAEGTSALEKQLAAALLRAGKAEYGEYRPIESAEKLMEVEPVPGYIVSKDSLERFDAVTYTLSNGIRVIAKRTDFKPDQIYIRAYSPGGLSLAYTPENVSTLRTINELMAEMPVGDHSAAQVRRMLGNKNLKVSVSVSTNEEGFEASTDSASLRDAFRMMHLRTTVFRPDTTAFRAFMAERESRVAQRHPNPTQAMGDSIHYIIYNRHPLAAHLGKGDIEHIDLDTALDVYRDRFSDMGDFTMMIIGDFNTDSIESCLKDYVASLPSNGRKEEAKPIGYHFCHNDIDINFSRAMQNPQGIVYSLYTGPAEYTLDNMLNANVFGQLLRTVLLRELREERALTYSVKAHCSINPGVDPADGPQLMMPTYLKVSPGHETECASAVNAAVESLCSPEAKEYEELGGIKEYLARNYVEASRDNAYWLRILKAWLRDGVDIHTDYGKAVESLTPESVAGFGKKNLEKAHKASLIMTATQAE